MTKPEDLMVVLPGVFPPLPIPNREVKPPMADGTAQQCGRVGSCHIHLITPHSNVGRFCWCPALNY
jgi:hypothetical protein